MTGHPSSTQNANVSGAGERHRVVIIGGGTAGITVAARLRRAGVEDVAVIEPSTKHYYQPLWTLVGAGMVRKEETEREEAAVMPRGVRWTQARAEEVDPESKVVRTGDGERVGYEFLVVCPGIQIDWGKIPGLEEALRTEYVSSNYDYQLAEKTARMIEGFEGGNAVFTNPSTPIKCGGAPQKIMYLASDTFRRKGVRDANVIFGHAGSVIFGVKEFAEVLHQVVDRYGIDVHYQRDLVEVRPDTKEAVFEIRGDEEGGRETIPYDIMHVTPPMSAPDFLKASPLSGDDPLGWVPVNKHTLQHTVYPEVFALGDVAALPTAKTGAAVRKQAPVVVENLMSVMAGREPTATYNGYSSCPLVTARNRMLLAEFDYDKNPAPSIPLINTIKERYDMYLLKRYGLPWMYWHMMLKGRA